MNPNIKNGSIILLNQTVNGENRFVIFIDKDNKASVRYGFDLNYEYQYDQDSLLEINKLSGEYDYEIVGNIYEHIREVSLNEKPNRYLIVSSFEGRDDSKNNIEIIEAIRESFVKQYIKDELISNDVKDNGYGFSTHEIISESENELVYEVYYKDDFGERGKVSYFKIEGSPSFLGVGISPEDDTFEIFKEKSEWEKSDFQFKFYLEK
jgi:hypothetical protein